MCVSLGDIGEAGLWLLELVGGAWLIACPMAVVVIVCTE